jgi:hypothetical protein
VLCGKSFAQTELKEGIQYTENTLLTLPLRGISFKIPKGWFGGVPQDSPFLILSDGSNDVTILVMSDELEEQKILDDLRNEIPLDQGITLKPINTPQQQGRRWFGEYTVTGMPKQMKGFVDVRLGNFGIGAGAIIVASPESFDKGKTGAIELLNSIEFIKPVNPQYAVSAGINMPWDQYLKGRSLKFYYTKVDFSETDFIHLCSNGTFQRSKRSSSGGVTGYGSISGNDQGTWLATGNGDTGTLILNHQDGTRSEFQLQYGEGNKGLGLYLNGSKYFIEISSQCN